VWEIKKMETLKKAMRQKLYYIGLGIFPIGNSVEGSTENCARNGG